MTGEDFKRIRKAAGYSQREFAEYVEENADVRHTASFTRHLEERDEVPARWVEHLKGMIGEDVFKELLAE